mmetsp:Transcript_21499/g.72361  ORF Transcript_21499/g.72361 Transcript_21499/m.72361 type:complete len:219 (-) Transcript_21499:1116-1772(-)
MGHPAPGLPPRAQAGARLARDGAPVVHRHARLLRHPPGPHRRPLPRSCPHSARRCSSPPRGGQPVRHTHGLHGAHAAALGRARGGESHPRESDPPGGRDRPLQPAAGAGGTRPVGRGPAPRARVPPREARALRGGDRRGEAGRGALRRDPGLHGVGGGRQPSALHGQPRIWRAPREQHCGAPNAAGAAPGALRARAVMHGGWHTMVPLPPYSCFKDNF